MFNKYLCLQIHSTTNSWKYFREKGLGTKNVSCTEYLSTLLLVVLHYMDTFCDVIVCTNRRCPLSISSAATLVNYSPVTEGTKLLVLAFIHFYHSINDQVAVNNGSFLILLAIFH